MKVNKKYIITIAIITAFALALLTFTCIRDAKCNLDIKKTTAAALQYKEQLMKEYGR